ncbi:MAG: hypothetical protein AAFW60_06730 [Pseudomonadota bacterium]
MRWLLPGPGAVILSVATMAAMPLFLPQGNAGIDHLVFPLILLPAIWAVIFFYVVLEENMVRATAILAVLFVFNAAVIGLALS